MKVNMGEIAGGAACRNRVGMGALALEREKGGTVIITRRVL